MGSVIYTPMMVVAQDEEIIKQVIEEEQNSNMSGDDIKAICSKIGDSKTKESSTPDIKKIEGMKATNKKKYVVIIKYYNNYSVHLFIKI